MASLNLSIPGPAGTAEAYSAAGAGGDSFPLPRDLILKIKNASGANRTVTVVAQNPCNQGVLHDRVIGPIATGTTIDVPVPGGSDRFRDAGGRVQLTYDNNAGLSVLAYPA
ncbi:MAG TPA: hypothetical protein VIK76_02300 [Pyrinomonadaceae bacterium]|jgi:hypothetical protein